MLALESNLGDLASEKNRCRAALFDYCPEILGRADKPHAPFLAMYAAVNAPAKKVLRRTTAKRRPQRA